MANETAARSANKREHATNQTQPPKRMKGTQPALNPDPEVFDEAALRPNRAKYARIRRPLNQDGPLHSQRRPVSVS